MTYLNGLLRLMNWHFIGTGPTFPLRLAIAIVSRAFVPWNQNGGAWNLREQARHADGVVERFNAVSDARSIWRTLPPGGDRVRKQHVGRRASTVLIQQTSSINVHEHGLQIHCAGVACLVSVTLMARCPAHPNAAAVTCATKWIINAMALLAFDHGPPAASSVRLRANRKVPGRG